MDTKNDGEISHREKWGDDMEQTFEINGRNYRTGIRTLELLREIMPAAKESGDGTAVMVVMTLGQKDGIILDITDGDDPWEGV